MNKLALALTVSLATVAFSAPTVLAQTESDPFTKADGNQDGKITMTEAMGQFATLTQTLFDQADANKDGVLDQAEYQALVGLSAGNEGGAAGNASGNNDGGGSSDSNGGSSNGNGNGDGAGNGGSSNGRASASGG